MDDVSVCSRLIDGSSTLFVLVPKTARGMRPKPLALGFGAAAGMPSTRGPRSTVSES